MRTKGAFNKVIIAKVKIKFSELKENDANIKPSNKATKRDSNKPQTN